MVDLALDFKHWRAFGESTVEMHLIAGNAGKGKTGVEFADVLPKQLNEKLS